MKHYIIDGNNLLGKTQHLSKINKKDKSEAARKLALIIGRYFNQKKVLVSLHFDGVSREVIKVNGIKIFHSGKLSADEKIKDEISNSKNLRNIVLVTSDKNLADFGRVCSCDVIKSEEFSILLSKQKLSQEKESIIEDLKDETFFKKLFGLD